MGYQIEYRNEFTRFKIVDFARQPGTRIQVGITAYMLSETLRFDVHLMVQLIYVHVTYLIKCAVRKGTLSRSAARWNPENCSRIFFIAYRPAFNRLRLQQ
jgi:hypothetical protein